MAEKSKEDLKIQINDLLADNTSGDISEADIRTVNIDAVDSLVSEQDPEFLELKQFSDVLEVTPSGDDKGVKITGQLEVGSWDDSREAVFGQGDSTTETMSVLHTNDDLTYTDVTSIFASEDSSQSPLFPDVTAGSTIYVGADFVYGGVKAKIAAAGVIEPENVVAEFWDGTAWQPVNFMATLSDYPHTQLGWNLASQTNSEQWRFDFDP